MQRQPGKSAALYARTATRETSGQNLENQMQRLLCHAHENALDIFMLYEDSGGTGQTLDRVALNSLKADIKAGYIDKVIVTDLARIGRDRSSVCGFIEWAHTHGVGIISIDEGCQSFLTGEGGGTL